MKQPSVSVVITTYNQETAVRQAIASVVGQTVPAEIIVVDDASTDGTAHIAQAATEAAGGRYIQMPQNQGVAAARNAGLAAAHGQYVMFLDGDDWIEPTKLAEQLQAFADNPGIDVCYCDSLIVRGKRTEPHTLKYYWPPHEQDMVLRLLQGNCVAVHAALLPTQLAQATGFNEQLRQAEDWDFWLRLAVSGRQFLFLDRPLVNYRRDHAASLSRDTASSLKSAWNVLESLDAARLTAEQTAALRHYQQGILLAQADAAIRSNRASGRDLLARAAHYGPLGTYRTLTLRLWQLSPALARLVYSAAAWLAHRRSQSTRPVLQ